MDEILRYSLLFYLISEKSQRKRHNIHIPPQAIYCSCIGTVHHRASLQSRLQPKPMIMDFGLQPYAALVCLIMASTP